MLMVAATTAAMVMFRRRGRIEGGFNLALYMIDVKAAQFGLLILFCICKSFAALFAG